MESYDLTTTTIHIRLFSGFHWGSFSAGPDTPWNPQPVVLTRVDTFGPCKRSFFTKPLTSLWSTESTGYGIYFRHCWRSNIIRYAIWFLRFYLHFHLLHLQSIYSILLNHIDSFEVAIWCTFQNFFFVNIFGMVFPSELYLNSEPEILVQ